MLQEITIPIAILMLDPNNPRFIRNLAARKKTPLDQVEKMQEETLKRFGRSPPAEDSEFDVTNIRDLYDSMLRIGFVGIDRIVVRPMQGGKFLVLEGNRRIATVKSILRDYETRVAPLDKPSARKDAEAHMASFETVTAMLLVTDGLTQEQIDHKVAIILGIRHHGSVLEWEPLPKAYNIYTEYMNEEPPRETFEFDNKKARSVANRLCIQTSDITRALRTYVAYLQVRERFPDVKDGHFSLIEYAVMDRHLNAAAYLRINQDTFELDEQSLTKLNVISQFATRDSKNPERTTNNKKKILQDPKQCKLLGRLIDRRQRANHQALTAYVSDLIQRVENEEDLEMTLDQAVDELTAFENRIKWVDAVAKLLKKQEQELEVKKYMGEGLDRGRKDELKKTLEPLQRVMNI